MTWSRFDDGYDEHDKVEEAWDQDRATIGLHVQATTACNRWLSDGVIKPRWLKGKLPETKERERVLAAMVEHALFDLLAAGATCDLLDSDGNAILVGPFAEDRYIVHDFLDRHDSSVQIKERRAADAERKRTGRRKDSAPRPTGVRSDAGQTPAGRQPDSGRSPLAAPPVKPAGNRARDTQRYDADVAAYAAALFPDAPEPHRTQDVAVALGYLDESGRGYERTNENVRRLVRNIAEHGTPFPRPEAA